MQIFLLFCTKNLLFYFTHSFLQNTHISLSILHVYSNKIFISLPTQPLTHNHRPTPVPHRNPHNPPATNPANQINKPEKQTQQPGINTTQQHNPHNPATQNRNKPNNTIHTTHLKSTPRLEQQDRRLQWR